MMESKQFTAQRPLTGPPGPDQFKWPISSQAAVGLILALGLIAFEIFNFDTTQYALTDLLGEIRFAGLRWATILAIAFCSIDFAGLLRLFIRDDGLQATRELWYLMGAWLLGATMNALMTWWAVSIALLAHELGNEVLNREQLLEIVPVFVAVLVWLIRVLFIGSFAVAGSHFLGKPAGRATGTGRSERRQPAASGPFQEHPPSPRPRPAHSGAPGPVKPAMAAGPVTESGAFARQRRRSPLRAGAAPTRTGDPTNRPGRRIHTERPRRR